MGITHFNKVSGVNGVYVRSATAGEIKVADADGIYKAVSGTTTVNISGSEGVVSHFWTLASTALGTAAYYTAPYACNVAGYVNFTVSSGTGRVVAVAHGSAGDNALATASGVTGSVGASVAMTASADTTFTAGEVMKFTVASCATAQGMVGLTVILTKTA